MAFPEAFDHKTLSLSTAASLFCRTETELRCALAMEDFVPADGMINFGIARRAMERWLPPLRHDHDDSRMARMRCER